jgi:hypothetical protein
MTSTPPSTDPSSLHDDEDASVTRSYIALAFVALLVLATYWVVDSFRAKNRIIECLAAHHQNCVPLDTSDVGH